MADSQKTLGDVLAEALKAAEPAFKQLAKDVDEAARAGHERFERKSRELDRKRYRIDAEINRRWRRRS